MNTHSLKRKARHMNTSDLGTDLGTLPGAAPGTPGSHRTEDPAAVALQVLGRLEAAWNAADGDAYGREYAPDASFVTVRGEHIVGRAGIAAGHTGILTTIYAGSVNRMRLVDVTEVTEGLLLVVSENTLDSPSGPLAGVHRAMSTSLVRVDGDTGRPQIVSTHNTLVMG